MTGYKLPALHVAILSSLLFFLLAASSCKKEYINGDLDGQWRVEEILVDGESHNPTEALYWNFSFHVVQLSRYGGPVANGNLSFDGSVIEMDFPTMLSDDGRDIIRKWGVYSNPAKYTVESISSSRLTIREGNVIVKMHKY